MTKEDKELLLKDLCARLPYMPKIKITYQQQGIKGTDEGNVSCDAIEHIVNDLRNGVITDMQIYLRPMSSMTDEEREEWTDLFLISVVTELEQYSDDEAEDIAPKLYAKSHVKSINWLNKHHFDYNGLIEKGLALEAPKGIYN